MYFAINNLIDNLKEKTIRYHLLFLAAAVCYFISNILWGLEFTDGFFHINEAVQNEGYYPFETILSSQILFLLNKIFGIHLVLYRLFNSLLILFSYYLIYNTGKKYYNKALVRLFTAVFIILASPMNFNILGFDSFSVITITAAVSFLLNNEMKNFKNILLLSILIACSMLVRMPNLFILPFTGVYFIYCRKLLNWKIIDIFKRYILLITLTLFLYISYLLIIYHSFSNIFHSFASQGGHHISKIIYHYYNDSFLVFQYLIVFILLYLFFILLKKIKAISLFALSILIFFYLYKRIYIVYHYHYAIIILSFITSLLIIYFFNYKKINYKIIFIFLTSLIICAGSNTGFVKMAFLSPIGMLCCMETTKFVSKQFIYCIIGILIPFSFLILSSETFEDKGYFKLSNKINVHGLNPIYTSFDHYKTVHEILDITDYLEKTGYKVVYYGFHSHLFSFLRPAPREKYTFYQPFDNSDEMNYILKKYNNQRLAIFLINGNNLKDSLKNKSEVELFLIKKGYEEMYETKFIIYTN